MSDQTNKKDDGGPAFGGTRRVPKPFRYDENEAINYIDEHYPGNLSMLDYLAAKAMQGLMANSDYGPAFNIGTRPGAAAQVAREAYAMADAMIAERNKKP